MSSTRRSATGRAECLGLHQVGSLCLSPLVSSPIGGWAALGTKGSPRATDPPLPTGDVDVRPQVLWWV